MAFMIDQDNGLSLRSINATQPVLQHRLTPSIQAMHTLSTLRSRNIIRAHLPHSFALDHRDEDAMPQFAHITLPSRARFPSRQRVDAQDAQHLLHERSFGLLPRHARRDRAFHQPFSPQHFPPRPVRERSVTQPRRLPRLVRDPGQTLDARGAVRHDRQGTTRLAAHEAEPADAFQAVAVNQACDEIGRRFGGGGGLGQEGVHDGASALGLDDILFVAEIGQHGDSALGGDTEPGALFDAEKVTTS